MCLTQPPRITFFLPAFLVISKVGGVGAIELVSKHVDGEQDILHLTGYSLHVGGPFHVMSCCRVTE